MISMTRWILNGIASSVTDSAKRGWLGVKTDAKILSDTVHDIATTPIEKQTQKKREEHKKHYQETVTRIKAKQAERKAIDEARNNRDNSVYKRYELASHKEKAAALLSVVESNLAELKQKHFPVLYRKQITLKSKEKDILDDLLGARTLAEFKLLSAKYLQVLDTTGNKNSVLREFLSKIIDENDDLKVEKKTALMRK